MIDPFEQSDDETSSLGERRSTTWPQAPRREFCLDDYRDYARTDEQRAKGRT